MHSCSDDFIQTGAQKSNPPVQRWITQISTALFVLLFIDQAEIRGAYRSLIKTFHPYAPKTISLQSIFSLHSAAAIETYSASLCITIILKCDVKHRDEKNQFNLLYLYICTRMITEKTLISPDSVCIHSSAAYPKKTWIAKLSKDWKAYTAGNVWFSEFSAFVKFAEFRFYKILPLL